MNTGVDRTVEVALDAAAELGEGPVWDDRDGRLRWVNIMAGQVRAFDPGSGNDAAVEVGQPVGALALRTDAGLVLALRDGFAFLEPDGRVDLFAGVEQDNPATRMNDGKADPAGRFWAGTMALDETPGAGCLYRLDTDGSVTAVLSGVTISNGLAWSLDARQLYYIDSPTRRVDVCDYDADTGQISARRPFVTVQADGTPDGMTVDTDGCLWVAVHGAGRLHRYTPSGALDRVVSLPAVQVTSCTFGGAGLGDLYVTSARQHMSEEDLAREPHAGALFVCRPGSQGLPADRCAL